MDRRSLEGPPTPSARERERSPTPCIRPKSKRFLMRLEERCGVCGSRLWCGRGCANAPVTNRPITNKAQPNVTNASDRVRRWRTQNRERYRAYMRDYMRERRAKEKL